MKTIFTVTIVSAGVKCVKIINTPEIVCIWTGSSTGTHVYTLNGSDPEGEPVTFDMTFDKSSKEFFSVEPKSGNVTLIQTLDREVRVDHITRVQSRHNMRR